MVDCGPVSDDICPNTGRQKPKKALVLSGGGSKGALQVGMANRLFDDGFRPDFVAGVSVGALNAFFLAQHRPDRLDALWREIKSSGDVYRTRWFNVPLMLFGWQWGYPSIYAAGPIRRKIRRYVKATKPEHFKAELRIGAVELGGGEFVGVDQTCPCLGRMLAGSMAIPIVFPPVAVEERKRRWYHKFLPKFLDRTGSSVDDFVGLYVDGCVRGRTPIAEAIKAGAEEVHILLTSGLTLNESPSDFRSILDIVQRTVEVILHEKLVDDIKDVLIRNAFAQATKTTGDPCRYREVKLYVYEPEDAVLQGMLDFDPEAIADCIDLGYDLAGAPKTSESLASWYDPWA